MQILCSKLTLEELLLGSSSFFFSPSDAGRPNCLVTETSSQTSY